MTSDKAASIQRYDIGYGDVSPDSTGQYVRYTDHAAALQAAIETAQRQAEIDSLDQWLRMAREPIGQECCGMGRFECCGDAVPVYATPNEVFKAMSKRHAELVAALAPAKKVD